MDHRGGLSLRASKDDVDERSGSGNGSDFLEVVDDHCDE